jgi:phosphatidylserine/phosphatidylglycerophosphate/cardiolipin synthase-like enzyme
MPTIPEEAVVDATLFDPLGAAALLSIFASRESAPIGSCLLAEICRKENLTSQRVAQLVSAFQTVGLIRAEATGYALAMSPDEAARHSAVLRGVAYAHHRYRDANHVEVTLSPPAHPSRLMEILPQKGFSWARLYHTKDSLIELANQARKRLVVISPFLDNEGVEWVGELFDATSSTSVERMLIVRGRDEVEIAALVTHQLQLAAWGAKVLTYAVRHDPGTRTPAVETFHAKIILADHDKAYVGSANMNRWSRDFSMECGVIIRGPCVRLVATLVDAIKSIAQVWMPLI